MEIIAQGTSKIHLILSIITLCGVLSFSLAGAGGIEPPVRVLETRGLPLTDAPSLFSGAHLQIRTADLPLTMGLL